MRTLTTGAACEPDLTMSSGVAHLEEIRNAGFELPAVNQVEVRVKAHSRIGRAR